MTTGADPAFKVTVCVEVDPTVTLPKLKLVGDTVSVLGEVLLELPDKATATLCAFNADTLKVPVKVPVVLGTNFSWIRTLLPAPRLDGVVIPANLKAPVMVAPVSVSVLLPLLRKVT